MKKTVKCHHPECDRLALETCRRCYRRHCPFHVAKMHMGWRSSKKLVCKSCYNNHNSSYYAINSPEKFPPFPEYAEDEEPGDVSNG